MANYYDLERMVFFTSPATAEKSSSDLSKGEVKLCSEPCLTKKEHSKPIE
jgi:hypothetical protein